MFRVACRVTKTQNQNPRLLLNLLWCHQSSGCLRFAKQAMVEKLVYIVLCEILICLLLGLYFENQAYPRTHFDEKNLILSSNYCFDYWWKFDILDGFAPKVGNSDLELKSGCEPTRSIVGHALEVGTQILDLFWVSVLFY